jgi:hypothetical protein
MLPFVFSHFFYVGEGGLFAGTRAKNINIQSGQCNTPPTFLLNSLGLSGTDITIRL